MQAIELFSSQFDDSADLRALANALLSPTLHLQQAYADLNLLRWIDTAVGMQLDGLGDILGIARSGRGDAAYRSALRFQTVLNTAKATPEDLITATRVLSGGDVIRYHENYPAGFQIFTNGLYVLDAAAGGVVESLLLLDDDESFNLDDASELLMRVGFSEPIGLSDILRSIAPAAVDNIWVSFSLGETPLFGFGGDLAVATFYLDNGFELLLDDNDSTLALILDEVVAPSGEFVGFSEFGLSAFGLDNDDNLAIADIGITLYNGMVQVDDGLGGVELVALHFDDDSELLLQSHQDNIDLNELWVFDSTAPAVGGGKLIEGMINN